MRERLQEILAASESGEPNPHQRFHFQYENRRWSRKPLSKRLHPLRRYRIRGPAASTDEAHLTLDETSIGEALDFRIDQASRSRPEIIEVPGHSFGQLVRCPRPVRQLPEEGVRRRGQGRHWQILHFGLIVYSIVDDWGRPCDRANRQFKGGRRWITSSCRTS